MAAGNDRVEGGLDPGAVLLGDDERRQQLDRMAAMTGDLAQNLVLLEQRYRDELTEQARAGRFKQVPRRLELEGFRRAELDPDHQSSAANVGQHFVTREHVG